MWKNVLAAFVLVAAVGCGDPYPDQETEDIAKVIEAWIEAGRPASPYQTTSDPCENQGPPACEWKANNLGGNIWKCRDVCGGTFWMMEFNEGGALCFTSSVWGYECTGYAP